jgi:capsular exopolysaccharide synthesis family protein
LLNKKYMSILKALQKKQSELPKEFEQNNSDSVFKKPEKKNTNNIVPFEKKPQNDEQTAFLKNDSIKIGTPSSAFNGQNDSQVGTALLDLKTKNYAGATLNAVNLPRSVEKQLPSFLEWDVEPDRVEPRLVTITHPHSSYCEEYRSLRTHILHKSQRQKLQSIVIASVNASEGKSVTALNFSWLMAQTDGIKALIIDADLRMPSLTDYLGIETDRGLSDLLVGNARLNDSIIKLQPSGLHILPGGEARSDVAELLSGPRFKQILDEAREMFDFVIIDAPPLGIFTDAAVLINHADGAMIVIRANKTRYSLVDRALENVPRDRMLGVVLNQSDDVLNESHYNYGFYNYDRKQLE